MSLQPEAPPDTPLDDLHGTYREDPRLTYEEGPRVVMQRMTEQQIRQMMGVADHVPLPFHATNMPNAVIAIEPSDHAVARPLPGYPAMTHSLPVNMENYIEHQTYPPAPWEFR